MAHTPKDDPSTYPALGRALTWIDRPGSANKIVVALVIVSVLFLAIDLTYSKYGDLAPQRVIGFYAFYGFISFSIVIFGSKALRRLIKRPEDYYGDKAVDTEPYLDGELDIKDNTDV